MHISLEDKVGYAISLFPSPSGVAQVSFVTSHGDIKFKIRHKCKSPNKGLINEFQNPTCFFLKYIRDKSYVFCIGFVLFFDAVFVLLFTVFGFFC